MARSSKSSPVEDLLGLVAHLPWWAGLLLAAVAYFGFHAWASQPVPAGPKGPGQLVPFAAATIGQTFASLLQYVVPFLCLVGAGASAWKQRQRRQLAAHAAAAPAADALDGISWQQFEQLVGESFRMEGYAVAENGGGGADGGVDLVLRKNGERHFVQCKQWRASKVGVTIVRELYGAIAAEGAAGGFVVTSGRFTADAITFARGRNVKLIDGLQLHAMLRRAQGGGKRPGAAPIDRAGDSVPACPSCGKAMVQRVARQGSRAGSAFWGCSAFPACKATRPAG